MFIQGSDNTYFRLDIIGYQFPELAHKEYDSNWLRIHMTVNTTQDMWEVTDPFLLTYEVEALADWLDDVAAHENKENEIGFLEPNLWLQVADPTTETLCLRVHFGAECRPPSAHTSTSNTKDIYAEFLLSDVDLLEAAESLRSQLKVYPQRTIR